MFAVERVLYCGDCRPAQDGEIKMSETSKQPGTYPSAADTLRMVRERNAEYDPLDRLLQLQRELVALESQHGLASAEMFRRFQAGELGDDVEIVAWVGRYRLFLELREMIADSLNLVVTLPMQTLA